MTRHFKTSDGLNLAFDDTGRGLPLLCLPGLSRNREDFDTVLGLSRRLRLIRMDYRGRGASDHGDWQDYTVEREAQDVIELLDHLDLPAVAILGTSRGGLIAMWLALTYPGRLTGVLLNDIGPRMEPEGLALVRDYVGVRPDYADFDAAATGLQHALADSFPDISLPQWVVVARRLYHQKFDGLDLRYDPDLRLSALRSLTPAEDMWPAFDALAGLPVAVLRGENSRLLSPETVARMAERHPGLRSATVRDRGHVPFLDEPECVAMIDDFLADIAP